MVSHVRNRHSELSPEDQAKEFDMHSIKCSFCDERFMELADLVVHEKQHQGLTPYKCYICAQEFQDKDDLKGHLLLHQAS